MPVQIRTFHSPTRRHFVTYAHLNPSAPHTVLFYYGGGSSAFVLTLFEAFISTHPHLSLLAVDRWTQPSAPSAAATEGLALLAEFSAITLELLDSLGIDRVGVAAHSAGVYMLLDFLRVAGLRAAYVFNICACIPSPWHGSKLLDALGGMPTGVFSAVLGLEGWVGAVLGPLVGHKESVAGERRVDGEEARRSVEDYEDRKDRKRVWERAVVDKGIPYCQVKGIGRNELIGLYGELGRTRARIVWFTTDGDVFFCKENVKRLLEGCEIGSDVEIVDVKDAAHADIFLLREVWDRIYEDMTT